VAAKGVLGDLNPLGDCVISTSGRLHGEFLRLLHIIAHRRTSNWAGGIATMSLDQLRFF